MYLVDLSTLAHTDYTCPFWGLGNILVVDIMIISCIYKLVNFCKYMGDKFLVMEFMGERVIGVLKVDRYFQIVFYFTNISSNRDNTAYIFHSSDINYFES